MCKSLRAYKLPKCGVDVAATPLALIVLKQQFVVIFQASTSQFHPVTYISYIKHVLINCFKIAIRSHVSSRKLKTEITIWDVTYKLTTIKLCIEPNMGSVFFSVYLIK